MERFLFCVKILPPLGEMIPAEEQIDNAGQSSIELGPGAIIDLNPVQEVDAAIKRMDAGFSTAQEETAQMTGGDYNRNIKLRMTEAKRKREVDEIGKAQTAGE